MMKKQRGVTLIEILITMTICALLMTTIYLIFKEGFGFYKKGSADTHTFQRAVIALERICRETQDHTVIELYYPDTDDLMAPEGAAGLVMIKEFPQDDTFEVIGYHFDDNRNEIVKVLYDPGYDPDEPSTQKVKAVAGARKIMAGSVLNLAFRGDDKGLLMIELVINGQNTERYLRTKISNEAFTW